MTSESNDIHTALVMSETGAKSRSDQEKSGDNEERDLGEMECSIYQNYSAAEVFVQGLAGVVNQQDVEAMIRAQKKM